MYVLMYDWIIFNYKMDVYEMIFVMYKGRKVFGILRFLKMKDGDISRINGVI